MRRLYNQHSCKETFGWSKGAYRLSLRRHELMPNFAVLCHATVKTSQSGPFQKVWVINLIGRAFDHETQPDALLIKTRSEVVRLYHEMWTLAFEAAKYLKDKNLITRIKLYNVGGGAFQGRIFDNFVRQCFEPSFFPLLPRFFDAGIRIKGYNPMTHTFNGGLIPDILDDPAEDAANTLYVNAWDPWSMLGNGNFGDHSLDGFWGRCSNLAVLGWPLSNPEMQYRAV